MPSKGDLVVHSGRTQAPSSVPRAGAVVDAIQRDTGGERLGHPLLDRASNLAAHHQRQWRAEDVSRDPDASVEEVAASKRLIDALNAQRVALIEEIDQWVAEQVSGGDGASLHTETLGSVVDRLAIAWVRANSLTTGDDEPDHSRLARSQLTELAVAYDDLVRDIAAGRRRLPRWRSLKTYRSSR